MQGGNCDYCVMADRAEKSAGAIWVGIMLMKSNKASHSLVYDRFMFVGSKFDVGVYI